MRLNSRRSRGGAVGGRRAALAWGGSVVAAGTAVTVFLTSGPAVAAPAPSAASSRSASLQGEQLAGSGAGAGGERWRDGGYVVLLDAAPAATYTGGVAGLAATKPGAGQRLSASSSDVVRYSRHLAAEQTDVLARVGARALHRYTMAVNGFSARLTARQAAELARTPGVASVTPDRAMRLSTVSSPEFLSLSGAGGAWEQLGGQATAGAGVVVGVLDGGVDPTAASFAGSPVTRTTPGAVGEPYRTASGQIAVRKARGGTFTGTCQTGPQFPASACTSKVVGARYFNSGLNDAQRADPANIASPVDVEGHGTHVASTAVGRPAKATIDGRDLGTARGMAPGAKLAVYKVCWEGGAGASCWDSDVVKAVDQAVADGVDVISASIGSTRTDVGDSVQLAYLAAAAAGIFVSVPAGNAGPGPGTAMHPSPWLTTVGAASTTAYRNTVRLGDGTLVRGASQSSTAVAATAAIYGRKAFVKGVKPDDAAQCAPGSLDPAKAKGKIVVCDRGDNTRLSKSAEVARAGGVGLVLVDPNPTNSILADRHSVPGVHLWSADRAAVLAYLEAQGARATVEFRPGDVTGKPAEPIPMVANFSGQGPGVLTGADVLKPDIVAPGVDILAALPQGAKQAGPNRFGWMAGTSMSTPHIAGLAALIYQAHPTWSPMAVKSAMMTTATSTFLADGTQSADATAQGAGFGQPKRFLTPGLVYDSGSSDWYSFLEGQGIKTGKGARPIRASELNQPSIALKDLVGTRTVTRTVTATTPGTYRASVSLPGIKAVVSPSTLTFATAGEKKTFTVTLTRQTAAFDKLTNGFLTWTSGSLTVRSPISVRARSASAQAEVTAATATATGSVSLPVTLGAPSVDVRFSGLAAATVTKGQIGVGEVTASKRSNAANRVVPVDVPAGTRLARVELIVPRGAEAFLTVYDSDLKEVFAPEDTVPRVAYSKVTPEAQRWWVTVTGAKTAPGAGKVPFELRVFLVPETSAGNATPSPRPITGAVGKPSTLTVRWSGLTAGTPHLGLLSYGADLTAEPTIVSVG